MSVPDVETADAILEEGVRLNPGRWGITAGLLGRQRGRSRRRLQGWISIQTWRTRWVCCMTLGGAKA